MNNDKLIDCIVFKNELHENVLKKSNAKNLREYVKYVNDVAQKSSLNKQKEKRK